MKITTNTKTNEPRDCDRSFIDIPQGFAVGITAYHERSDRFVVLKKRELGDGWICQPVNGDRAFYEHSKYLKPT